MKKFIQYPHTHRNVEHKNRCSGEITKKSIYFATDVCVLILLGEVYYKITIYNLTNFQKQQKVKNFL
jgi:hypothetical protein